VPPRNLEGLPKEAGGEDDGEVGAAVETDFHLVVRHRDGGGEGNQIAKNLPRLRVGLAAHPLRQQAVESAGQNQQRHVEIDLESDG
jgi:hypothetical protein